MKAITFSRLKKLALFFITPLTYRHLEKWQFYTIYILFITPAILITFNAIDRYHEEHIRNEHMNKSIIKTYGMKKQKAYGSEAHYLEFSKITKQNKCQKLLSTKEAEEVYSNSNITNKKWLKCINKYTFEQRVNNFISKNIALLELFNEPVKAFNKLSTITQKTTGITVQYISSEPKEVEFFTVLPVKLKFNSSFKEALEYIQKLTNKCYSCKVSVHELKKTRKNNNYDITLMVRINLDLQDSFIADKLSKQVSSGIFSGNNLSNFVKEYPQLL